MKEDEQTERRVFTNKEGHRSGVLRGKKGESEEDSKARLSGKKGWNMEIPYKRTENEDGSSTFKATDPKKRKKKAKPSKPEESPMESEDKDTSNDEPSEKPEDESKEDEK